MAKIKQTGGSKLERTMFETSRAAEYFDAKELQAQTGQPLKMFPTVVLKELIDNALDACESFGVAPVIDIAVSNSSGSINISVRDNAGGIASRTIKRILNFQTRTSDKTVYRSPTRGAQGNALKTVLGIPCAMGSKKPIIIESKGIRHSILAWIDPAGELRIEHGMDKISTTGTSVRVTLPEIEDDEHECQPSWIPRHWTQGFALFNPHALVRISDFGDGIKHGNSDENESSNSYHPTVTFPGEWRKFLPTDLTSPWWYSKEDLERLIFSHIGETRRNGKNLTLREFVRQFRGLSGTAKAKTVCDQFPEIDRLSDFETSANAELIGNLWRGMHEASKPPAPTILGIIGEEHFKTCFDKWFGIKPNRFWYVKKVGSSAKERLAGEIPFVFEVAIAETEEAGSLFTGLNFSPTYEDFLQGNYLSGAKVEGDGIQGFLRNSHIDLKIHTVAVHLACPTLNFMDRGKTRLKL